MEVFRRLKHASRHPLVASRSVPPGKVMQGFFSRVQHKNLSSRRFKRRQPVGTVPAVIIAGAVLIYSLYPSDDFRRVKAEVAGTNGASDNGMEESGISAKTDSDGVWSALSDRVGRVHQSVVTDVPWASIPGQAADYILPEWSKQIPSYLRKLQRELSFAPGSLAYEIWQEAQDPYINPEIRYTARVRVSTDLNDDEIAFLAQRRKMTRLALSRYLGLDPNDVDLEDVPVIAACGSGGGLRALVAGAGSLLAASEDGLFDCFTYTSGVSGSCWLQALQLSSLGQADFRRVIQHLQNRLGIHIADPPTAFNALVTAPTNKLLLANVVEKLKSDPNADFGTVDVYGILLGARLLVPKGELGVNPVDFKLSNQQAFLDLGQNPLPIYSVVRHEIPNFDPGAESQDDGGAAKAKEQRAKKEAWFQWFEITPYEFFCEEFNAGIPTWAMGRKFKDGRDQPLEETGLNLPEMRMPTLLGILGSAFTATLSHYYQEIRPLIRGMTGFSTVDEIISANQEDLAKTHPFDPASIPNFAFGMQGKLPSITPRSILENEYIQLMDAGMSNNLPIYPLIRPGRDVEVILAFDASADIKTDNWLSVADGYARQRGVRGWPVGVGWPKSAEPVQQTVAELDQAQAASAAEADDKLSKAKKEQSKRRHGRASLRDEATTSQTDSQKAHKQRQYEPEKEDAGELGYCTVWVGTTQERASEPPPPSKAINDSTSWQLTEPNAGITIIYLPFLTNNKVSGVDPAKDQYMGTYNFVYTPEQINKVVSLAQANYDESKVRIKQTIRAVYERKKKIREDREERVRQRQFRRLMQLGVVDKLGEGDHFS
jgi:cytosolic phospholipase A2